MGFIAGILFGLMLVVSIPGIVGAITAHDLSMKNWRLARTCLVGMALLFFGLFVIMMQADTFTEGQSSMIVMSVLVFSIPAGIYANTWFDHSVQAAEIKASH